MPVVESYTPTSWDTYFMGLAKYVSTKSKDRSTKVGCVIVSQDHQVVSTGYNGFPRGCYDEGSTVTEQDAWSSYCRQLRTNTPTTLEDLSDFLALNRLRVEDRHARPLKYKWTEHAERNAIYAAAEMGHATKDCRIYVPWFPCVDCARAIIQCGIREMVAFKPDFEDPRWGEDFRIAVEMLDEAGVAILYIPKED